jgi:hypothetical protein
MTVTLLQINKRNTYPVDEYHNQWNAIDLLIDGVDWTTDIETNPGELVFTLMETDDGFRPEPGDSVRFDWNGKQMFYGYIFKLSYTQDKKYQVTAYDKLRYFKNSDSIVWQANTASDRFASICGYTNVNYRVVHGSNFKLAGEIADGTTFFDMIKSACEKTKTSTGKHFYVRDVNGTVEFTSTERTSIDLIVGDGSLATTWQYDESIDEAANFVRVVKMDSNGNFQMDAFASDASSMARWGKLQMLEKADDKMNKAQMQTRANELLKANNYVKNGLTITALGHEDIRAGVMFYLNVSELQKHFGITQRRVLANKVTHHFQKNWTMEIEALVN